MKTEKPKGICTPVHVMSRPSKNHHAVLVTVILRDEDGKAWSFIASSMACDLVPVPNGAGEPQPPKN